MAVKWETVKAGDVLYDVHREKMGNTTMSRMGCWPVQIVEIDHEAGKAIVRWNHNSPRPYRRHQVEKLRRKPYQAKGRA